MSQARASDHRKQASRAGAKAHLESMGLSEGPSPESSGLAPEQLAGPPGRSPWRMMVEGFADRGIMLIAIIFVIEVALFFAVSNSPFLPGEKQQFSNSAKQLANTVANESFSYQLTDIFSNNIKVAMVELIPGFGAAFFGISIYNTARIVEVAALQQNLPPSLVVAALFVFPHSWIELPAYAIATAEGIYLLRAVIQVARNRRLSDLVPEIWQLALTIMIVTVTLLVAAFFETFQLQLGLAGLILWVPFIGILAVVLNLRRRLSRIRQERESGGQYLSV